MQHDTLRFKENVPNIGRWLSVALLVCIIMMGVACQSSQKNDSPEVTRSKPDAKRLLGYFKPVEGTRYLIAPVTSRSGYEYRYDSNKDAHNYVFFNTADESILTLLPSNDYLFVETLSLPEKREGDKEAHTVRWFLYGIVRADTNGDKELNYKDQRSLSVSDAGGVGFKEIITDVEQVYGQALADGETLIVIYRKGSKNYTSRIDLPSREVISTKEMLTFGIAE